MHGYMSHVQSNIHTHARRAAQRRVECDIYTISPAIGGSYEAGVDHFNIKHSQPAGRSVSLRAVDEWRESESVCVCVCVCVCVFL